MDSTKDLATSIAAALERIRAAESSGQLPAPAAKNLRRWLTEPGYAEFVPALLELVAASNWSELDRLFWEQIPFGTGGRRGEMAALGSATINVRTISESADGLAAYLKQVYSEGCRAVIAWDTRNRSAEFGRLTASVLAGHGMHVFVFDGFRATPELSFAVRRLNCHAGVMISASHNPPSDNGFKAYWTDGTQVLPPHDKNIIRYVEQAGEIPRANFDEAVGDGRIEIVGAAVDKAYVDSVTSLSLSERRDVRALFSPLHGVGESSVYRVLQEAGFDQVEIFEPQRSPDGNFPNVVDHFPNPERTDVFAPAIEHAQRNGMSLVLASDPDADRLGVAARDKNGSFQVLTGNQVGALLAEYILARRAAAGNLTPRHYVVQTLVTTPLIPAIARSYNVRIFDRLLVGFRYIAQTIEREGADEFVFGAEESLGYLAGDYCRDKDAAVAALYLLESAAELEHSGKTLLGRLDELYVEHGYFLEQQKSIVCPGSQGHAQIQRMMEAFRKRPPASFGGVPLKLVDDYLEHETRSLPDNAVVEALPEPQGNLLVFSLANPELELRIAVRPSGTEPKIKFYFFAQTKPPSASELPAVKGRTSGQLDAVQQDLVRWAEDVSEEPAG